ncbi:MAG: glycosyltransferase family 39 protein [Anaerolineae bacterium]|nr:glycosyltransferase family 39 protein [Anaerolineae bacterium]
MSDLARRLLDPQYLYALDPGPLGRWALVYLAWAMLLLLGLGWQVYRFRQTRRTSAAIGGAACAAGLALLGLRFAAPRIDFIPDYARFLLFDAWTARMWPLSATAIALLAPLLGWIDWRASGATNAYLDALTGHLTIDSPPLFPWQTALWLALHLLGLGWLWHSAGQPVWWALPSLLLLLGLPLLARPRRIRAETLKPLLMSYAASLICALLRELLKIDVEAYQGFRLPDPLSPWLNAPVMITVGVLYTVWIQLKYVSAPLPRRWQAVLPPTIILLLTVVWFGSTVLIHRTHGVTASDPYCYVQMAVDLAETGSPLHAFPLAGLASELGLPTWPAVHIGYHPPTDGIRSPTMWPFGWPLLMVPFYWLGGLDALYWAAPLMALLALAATWALVNELLRAQERAIRWMVAALTCFLVATSPEGAERMLVPMADAAAQLFTVLMLWLLLRADRDKPVLYGALAGFCCGWAYLIRHPQLPLGTITLALMVRSRHSLKARLGLLVAFGTMALLVAIPDLVYHQTTFGSWLNSESTEWFLLSPAHIPQSLVSLLEQGLFRREEIGFLLPFLLLGGVWLWRHKRRPFMLLGTGTVAVLLFHLCYEALRPRDLIALLPVLYLCAASGFVLALRHLAKQQRWSAALLTLCCLTLLVARSFRSLELPWKTETITFGYLSGEQRAALQTLRESTPANAVIGSMLNGGAIELYAQRQAIHPSPWTTEQVLHWIHSLSEQNRPFYQLDDGEESAVLMERLAGQVRLTPICTLNMPYFAYGGGNLPRPAVLYHLSLP